MTTPSSWYEHSPRPLPRELPQPECPFEFYTFRVPDNGVLPWRGRNLYISDCLAGEYIAPERVAEDEWNIYFSSMRLGRIARVDGRRKPQFAFLRTSNVERVCWEDTCPMWAHP